MAYFKQGSLIERLTSIATSGGITALTVASNTIQQFTGTFTQTVTLPNATTLAVGRRFLIANRSTQAITVNFFGGALAVIIPADFQREIILVSNGSSAGSWDISTGATGSGSGVGGSNLSPEYAYNGRFETDTSGWAIYDDGGASVDPVDGQGGVPAITLSRSTSSPIREIASGLITKDAADRRGQGVSFVLGRSGASLGVDPGDYKRAGFLDIAIDYEASANFVVGDNSDIRVWIRDEVSGALIGPSRQTIDQSGNGQFKASFQTNALSGSYRVIIHIATTNANSWTFKFEMSVTPQSRIDVAQVRSPQKAGFIQPFAGASDPSGWMICDGRAISRATYSELFSVIGTTFGSGDGSTTFNLPDLRGRTLAGLDVNQGGFANRLTTGAETSGINGQTLGASGGTEAHPLVLGEMPGHNHGGGNFALAGHKHRTVFGFDASGALFTHANGSTLPEEGSDVVNVFGHVAGGVLGPSAVSGLKRLAYTQIANLSSQITLQGSGLKHQNTQPTLIVRYIIKLYNDSVVTLANENVAASANKTTLQSIPNATYTSVIFNVTEKDVRGSYNPATGEFTAHESGFFEVGAVLAWDVSGTGNRILATGINGVVGERFAFNQNPSAASTAYVSGSATVYLMAGQKLTVMGFQDSGGSINVGSGGLGFNRVVFKALPNASAVVIPQSVNARYTTGAGQLFTHNTQAIVDFGTKSWDNLGLVTTGVSWRFTANRYLKLRVGIMLSFNGAPGATQNALFDSAIFKNGVFYSSIARADRTQAEVQVTSTPIIGNDEIELNAGEYFDIRASQSTGVSVSLISSSGHNRITIHGDSQ